MKQQFSLVFIKQNTKKSSDSIYPTIDKTYQVKLSSPKTCFTVNVDSLFK